MRNAAVIGLIILVSGMLWDAPGKIPEPDTILVGSLTGENGVAIVPPSGQKLIVRAVVDGATLATAEVPNGGDGRFVLRVPMDDGVAPRITGTAKTSDRIRVVVDNTAAGLSAEAEETKNGGVEIPAGRGNILALSFSVSANILSDDVNANGIPDSWEGRYTEARNGHNGISLARDDSLLDNDGDGFTNREEWIAGTDPLDEASIFSIRAIEKGTALRVTFGPLTKGRLYTLRRSVALAVGKQQWEDIATMRAESDAESFAWTLPAPSTNTGFYRIAVEVAE